MFVDLGSQHAMHMRQFVLICIQLCLKTFLILTRIKQDMIKKMYIDLRVKYPLILSILMKLEISRQILEKTQISNFMKIHQWEPSCSLQTDERDEANG